MHEANDNRSIRLRLCILQFLLFSPLGAFLPMLTVHLKSLGFTSFEIASISATQFMGGLVSLFFVGQIADRWLPANRCLVFLSFLASGILWNLADCTEHDKFFRLCFLYWIIAVPISTLSNTICFAHLPNPARQFGGVRMWGTIGWVVQGWILAYWLSSPLWIQTLLQNVRPTQTFGVLADQFHIASIMAFIMSLYAITLPHTPPARSAKSFLAPLQAMKLLKYRHFAVFLFCHFGMCVTFRFSVQNTPLLLEQLGMPRAKLSVILTICQSTEIFALLGLQWIVIYFGIRRTILIGMTAWLFALTVLMLGQPVQLVIASLGLHGIFVGCVLVMAQVFVNKQASPDIRASALALVTFTGGLGMLTGDLVVGKIREMFPDQYTHIFTIAVVLNLALITLFFIGFRIPSTDHESS